MTGTAVRLFVVALGAILSTPSVSSAGWRADESATTMSAGAAPDIPHSVVTGRKCTVSKFGPLKGGATSWISGSTMNETASVLRGIAFEKNDVGMWDPAPAAGVAAHGKSEWCAFSLAGFFGGTSVRLVYMLPNFDHVIFDANVTASFGGDQSCVVVPASPASTTRCAVRRLERRPFLGVDFVVSDR